MKKSKIVFLVEPDYVIKYPNLALMKFSAKHKKKGDKVYYIKGIKHPNVVPDIIYISTMFTYYAKKTIETINYYKQFSEEIFNSELFVGGIFASLMPDYIYKYTGIKPIVGFIEELDRTKPDYSLVYDMIKVNKNVKKYKDYSMLFTMRGCKRRCPFCAVKTLEPKMIIYDNWKDLVDLNKPNIMISDNNITTAPIEHFKDVMNFLIKHNLKANFNNGFDCRVLTDEHIYYMSKVRWDNYGLRLAFDNMSEDGYIQKAIKKLLKLGVPRSAFLIFCMYNFMDTPEEAYYRLNEIYKLGVYQYPQIYRPLDSTVPGIRYTGKHWDLELVKIFRKYWLFGSNYRHKDINDFLRENNYFKRRINI